MSDPKDATPLPERFGRYEVVTLLDTGGMAEVYLARLIGPERFERAVVVKRILPHLARDKSFRTMFVEEARLAGVIHHPNVVTVHELAQSEGELYLVMDYVEGETLMRLLQTAESMPMHVGVHILAEACSGLHAAHELVDEEQRPRGIVHRDVSPQNLMIDYQGAVRVLDFGIASAFDRVSTTQSGMVKGKIAYMSPEQARGQKVDRQTDVFALGVMLYEVTTRQRLFARADNVSSLRAICLEPIPSPSQAVPSYPTALEAIVKKALARDRSARYATAAELRRALLGVLRDLDPEGRAPEDLVTLMQTTFAERQKEKRDLMRQASVTSARRIAARARRARVLGLAIVVLLGVGAGAFFRLRASSARPTSSADASITEAPPVETAPPSDRWVPNGGATAEDAPLVDPSAPNQGGVAADAPLIDPAAPNRVAAAADLRAPQPALAGADAVDARATVRLEVVTEPPGALVSIDGEPVGRSPLDLARPRDGREHTLSIAWEGAPPSEERWTADVDQRLRFELAPAPIERPRTRRRRGRPATPEPAPSSEARSTYFRL